jgi:uncharacterized membrane protein
MKLDFLKQKIFILQKNLIVFKEFLLTDKGQKIIALLPLFFSWVPVLVYHFENNEIKKKCIQAIILSFSFIFILLFSFFISGIPLIGGIVANLLHFVGIIGYLSVSIFLVYGVWIDKNIEIQLLNKYSNSIEKLLN